MLTVELWLLQTWATPPGRPCSFSPVLPAPAWKQPSLTIQQVLLEYQRDWSRKETYDAVMSLVREHSGAYGMGVDYAYTLVHGAPERKA